MEAEAPGHPCFVADLLRDRAGAAGRGWTVEWNRDRLAFTDIPIADISGSDISGNGAALPGRVVSAAAGGPDHPAEERRAG